MAGNQNSGGMRPTAPQNNPANVNALGGNGQSGKATADYTGFTYGENQALAEQKSAAPMSGTSAAPTGASANPMANFMSSLTPLDAPSGDALPISDGVDFGRGRGSEALPTRVTSDLNQSENIDLIKKYLPDLLDATRFSGTPDSYKRFVNYLKARIL
jgi:hypothetical protein